MPVPRAFPAVTKCCGCVTDLKTAAAIIAVLGIVTSPALSWAIVRHSYVIRVSCFVTTSASRPDVFDINLNNILSFGFSANAGLGPSCLSRNNTPKLKLRELEGAEKEATKESKLVAIIRFFGWIVLLMDLVFVMTSINFLIKIFKGQDKSASKSFMIAAILSVFLSFVYSMMYVASCLYVGGSFPIFEFFFSIFDLVIYAMWIYFSWVIYVYYRRPRPDQSSERAYYCPLIYWPWTSRLSALDEERRNEERTYLRSDVLKGQKSIRYQWTLIHWILIMDLFISVHRSSTIIAPRCKNVYKFESPVLIPLYVFMYLLFICEMMLMASGFIFLLSIFFKPYTLPADFYICCAMVAGVLSIVYAVIVLVQEYYVDCLPRYEALNFFVYFAVWTYFVFVINTYRNEIEEY